MMDMKNYMNSRGKFCDLLNDARLGGRKYSYPGSWSGSAFRSHPCGIVKGNILMANHWSTYNYCHISITDGEGWDIKNICTESWAYGNPFPQPINGEDIRVWSDGKWSNDEYKKLLEPICLEILKDVFEHVCRRNNWENIISAQKRYTEKINNSLVVKTALEKALA